MNNMVYRFDVLFVGSIEQLVYLNGFKELITLRKHIHVFSYKKFFWPSTETLLDVS